MNFIELAQDRERRRALVNAAMNLRDLEDSGDLLTRLGQFSFSRRTLLQGVNK
jgi:hypothetical protein